MKYYKYLIILIFPPLMAMDCKKNILGSPSTPTVKLSVAINNNAETIYLGDTLKFILTIPDTLIAISKTDGTTSKVFINSLQTCSYGFTFYNVDTITKTGIRVRDAAHIFVTVGTLASYLDEVYPTHSNKPFLSVLNIIPPAKGIYYIEFGRQETLMSANLTFNAGLRMNIDVTDKHWLVYANYFNDTNQPDFLTSMNSLNDEGYGFYCFRVN